MQDIVIGRHRDMEDRISWCLAVGRYEAALSLAEADRTTTQELWDSVVQVSMCCMQVLTKMLRGLATACRLRDRAREGWHAV